MTREEAVEVLLSEQRYWPCLLCQNFVVKSNFFVTGVDPLDDCAECHGWRVIINGRFNTAAKLLGCPLTPQLSSKTTIPELTAIYRQIRDKTSKT